MNLYVGIEKLMPPASLPATNRGVPQDYEVLTHVSLIGTSHDPLVGRQG